MSSDVQTSDQRTQRKALVVRGGWEGHRPVAATDAFVPFLRSEGFEVRIEDSPSVYADAQVMAETDLVLQCVTMSAIEGEAFAGLQAAVEAGTGLAGWHGGIADSYRNTADYLHLIGGTFAAHPRKLPPERVGDETDAFVPYRIQITDAGRAHPITEGIEDFGLSTEQYWVLSDEYNEVLATTTHPVRPGYPWTRPVTTPAVWTRQWGQGRIFVCTPGHTPEVLADVNVRSIVERGLRWAARGA